MSTQSVCKIWELLGGSSIGVLGGFAAGAADLFCELGLRLVSPVVGLGKLVLV